LIVPNGPAVSQWRIIVNEMFQAAAKTPADIGDRDIMTTRFHPVTHPRDGNGRIWQPEIMGMNPKAFSFRLLQ